MSIAERVADLTIQLQEGEVRQRRQAVADAARLLQDPDCDEESRETLIGLLRTLLEHEPMITIREAAVAALTTIAKAPAHRPLLADDRQDMIGVRCPSGHVTYFNKRRICLEKTTFVRTLVRDEAGRELDELVLPCGVCDTVVKVRVDCGAYR